MATLLSKRLLSLFIKSFLMLLVVCYSDALHAQLNSNPPTALSALDATTSLVGIGTESKTLNRLMMDNQASFDNTNGMLGLSDTTKTPIKSEQDRVHISVTPSGDIALVEENVPQLVLGTSNKGLELDIKASELVECHCFGKVTGDCYSTGALGPNYSLPCKTQPHQNDCCGRVKNAIAALSAAQKQTIADCLCSKNVADNTKIYATAAVATSDYEKCDGEIGTLHQKPAYSVTTCTCPTGWLANPTNVDGGVTSDGKCKKGVCGPWNDTAFSHPPNGTPVGTWGFTWENGLYTWGTTANGGAAKCVTVNYPKGPCTMTW